jgi:hypothetical protein
MVARPLVVFVAESLVEGPQSQSEILGRPVLDGFVEFDAAHVLEGAQR